MILTRTPMRVSMFGGGSDHPEHFLHHGGAVLGMAIDKYVYVGVKRMPPGQIGINGIPIRYRVQYSHVDDCLRAEGVQHPAIRAALQYLAMIGHDEPMEFHCFADLPGRSGLGGSSSFVVGLLAALQAHHSLPGNGSLCLAREAVAFEQLEAGGFQDQIFAAVGGVQYIEFGVDSTVNPISLTPTRRRELEQSLVLVYSGTMRDGHAMAAKQLARIETNTRDLRRMSDFAIAARALLIDEHEPLATIGRMLGDAWHVKRDLHPEISTTEIDSLYARGLALGALGGKLCGAGGGGFLLFFVPQEWRVYFEKYIGAPCVSFKIAQQGSHILVNEP